MRGSVLWRRSGVLLSHRWITNITLCRLPCCPLGPGLAGHTCRPQSWQQSPARALTGQWYNSKHLQPEHQWEQQPGHGHRAEHQAPDKHRGENSDRSRRLGTRIVLVSQFIDMSFVGTLTEIKSRDWNCHFTQKWENRYNWGLIILNDMYPSD